MDFSFSREHEMLRKTVREFAELKIAPMALELDDKGQFEPELVASMGQQGLIGLVNSKKYGGSGMGHLARLIAIEELSRIYPSLGFFLQTGNFAVYLLPIAGGSFIYIAVADLIPEIYKEKNLTKVILNIIAILIGLGVLISGKWIVG